MAFDIHTISIPKGSAAQAEADRLHVWFQNGVASGAGSGAGTSVTTAVSFTGEVPATYTAIVTPAINATVAVTNKSATGFNVLMTPPLAATTLAASTFDVLVIF